MFGWLKKYSRPSALKANGVLGMNARNYNIISRLNDRRLYPLVDDKVKTKVLAGKAGINTPRLIGVIEYQHQVKDFIKIVEGCPQFVIKPAHGSGGKGVLVINRWEGQRFFTASGKELGFQDVFRHISNTLSGLFSLGG